MPQGDSDSMIGDTGSKHYDRAAYMAEKREAMQTWNDWLAGVIQSPNG